MVRIYLALGLSIVALITACGGQSTPTRTSTPPPAGVTPTPTAPAEPRQIVLDTAPKPQPPEVSRQLGPPPPSVFLPWDGKSTVIYDTKTGKETNLGPGSQPAYFGPDSTKAVWTNGTDFASGIEAFVVDLASGAISSLGPATSAMFIDDTHVFIYKYKPGGNDSESIDLVTGARGLSGGNPGQNIPPLLTPDGYEIVHWHGASFQVLESKTRQPVMSFDALDAVPVGAGQIAVASQVVGGQSNIFMVDVKTATATFLATAAPGSGAWPFSANSQYVMWTDNYCGDPNGKVNLFDLKTKQLTQVDFSAIPSARWVKFTPSGLIAAGSFGAKYLIDPVALSYVAQIPQSGFGGGDVSWSPDYRYASHGPTGGHGGMCGG